MNFLLADIVEPVVCSVAGSSIFVGIVVRLLFVFRNIGRVKFYFSFLFIGLEYTCLHSQLLIDGHVHHWIMATRGSAYLLRTCSWVCWRLWRFEGETSSHGEWQEVSLFGGYLIYIMCDSCIEGKYMKNSQRKMACGIGLSLVFLQKRPSKKG